MTTINDNSFVIERLIEITTKEVKYFKQSRMRIIHSNIDLKWLEDLENNEQNAEMLEAFVSRFGRLQDTVGDKLLPAILKFNLESVGSLLDNVLKAEKLGWLESADLWVQLRGLRNRLVHEYMTSTQDLLSAIQKTIDLSELLIETQNALAVNFKSKKN